MAVAELASSWREMLGLDDEYFEEVAKFLSKERSQFTIYPPDNLIFKALNCCAFDDVKVVILGQDPYHGSGQAMGLSFSVPRGEKIPPSLRNIYKELEADLGIPQALDGDLTPWAEQGVLLLNTSLSVREAKPGSHSKGLWNDFSKAVIQSLSERRQNVVFVLWGAHAQGFSDLIDSDKHLILESVHPSPLSASRGFFGSKPFSKINSYLKSTGQETIDWRLEQLLF